MKKSFSKSLALMLAFALMLTALSVPFTASAAEETTLEPGYYLMNTGLTAHGVKGDASGCGATNLPNGGIHLQAYNVGKAETYLGAVNPCGFSLKFDNFMPYGANGDPTKNVQKAQLAIILGGANSSYATNSATSGGNGFFKIILDPLTGKLYSIPSAARANVADDGKNETEGFKIIESEYLKAEHIFDTPFTISTSGNVGETMTVTVEVAGQKLTGTVPFERYSIIAPGSGVATYSAVMLSVGTSYPSTYPNQATRGFDIDWIATNPGNANGVDNGYADGNFIPTKENCTISAESKIDQGIVVLAKEPANQTLEFKLKDAIDVRYRAWNYGNGGKLDVYVDGNKASTLSSFKNASRWRDVVRGLDPAVEHTIKFVNVGTEPVIIDGIYVKKAETINTDGYIVMHKNLTAYDLKGDSDPNMTVTDLTNGGIRFGIHDTVAKAESYIGAVNIGDTRLLFNNFTFKDNDPAKAQLAIIFGNPAGGNYMSCSAVQEGFLKIVIDPSHGIVYGVPNGKFTNISSSPDFDTYTKGYKIIESNLIKGGNLSGRPFSVATEKVSEGLKVTIEVGGEKVSGILPEANLESATTIGPSTLTAANLSLGLAWPAGEKATYGYEIDWVGVDPGAVQNKEGNFVVNAENTVSKSEGAVVDQSIVVLKNKNDFIEFKVSNAAAVEYRAWSYGNSSSVEIDVDGNYETGLSGLKYVSRWRSAATELDPNKEHTIKILNTNSEPIVIDGLFVVAPKVSGDLDGDGQVNAADITILRKVLLGAASNDNADVNGDGAVNILDLINLKKKVVA